MKYELTEQLRKDLIVVLGEVPAKLSGELLTILKNPDSFPQFLPKITEQENVKAITQEDAK